MSVHKVIQDGRIAIGKTVDEFAEMCGVSRGSVQQWEKGTTAPNRSRQKQVADALRITVAELMSGQVNPRLFSPRAMRIAQMFDACQDPERQRIAYSQAEDILLPQVVFMPLATEANPPAPSPKAEPPVDRRKRGT